MQMSGASGLSGYTYQKDYAAFRILSSEAMRLVNVSVGTELVESFVVEGPAAEGGSAWDMVWKTTGGGIHVRECKDTEIKKVDRLKFYRRVRKEVANAREQERLTIGWVTDAAKQGNIIDHWREMGAFAVADELSIAATAPTDVTSAKAALSEAVFYLCTEATEEAAAAPPVPLGQALALVREMKIETFRAEELSRSVSDLAASLFERGLGSAIRKFIQGEFDTVIQERREAAYTRDQFLAVVKGNELAVCLAATYREILQFQSGTQRSFDIAGIKWARLPGAPEKRWSLQERLPEFDPEQSRVLVASTGDGKTTSCQQAFHIQLELRPPIHVLWFDAGTVSAETARSLPMLCLLLCGVAPTWIAIDGIDQISRDKFDVWSETLDRMQTIPQLTMLVSVRSEVVGIEKWMQKLRTSLGEIHLGPLTSEQIDNAFEDNEVQLPSPANPSLRSCLQNPFLFSVYAQTVNAEDMPLERSGEVEAFNVIEEFWKQRVTCESPGARGAGDPMSSHVSKRAAVAYLAEQTLCGHVLFAAGTSQANVANGIEMLCNESVLSRHSTNSVKWSHAWYREYAIVDHLLGTMHSPCPETLVESVCKVSSAHVSRDAANGGCKWLIAHPEQGNAGGYLQLLYENRRELAREVLFDVMDGAERHLTLSSLSLPLLIEAIELACQKRAAQWARQVSELRDELFGSEGGSELARVVVDYETKVTISD